MLRKRFDASGASSVPLGDPGAGLLVATALAVSLVCGLSGLAQAGPEGATLTPDQLAIVEKIAKPPGAEEVRYVGAPTDPIGAEVRLPFREGAYVTLVRKGSTIRKDGSVSWHGEVAETGERAVLMLWNNALLSGYFAYNGTILTVESLGGGVHAVAEMDRNKVPEAHPSPTPARDSLPVRVTDQPATLRPAPPEPKVAPFTDADRLDLEAKGVTIDVMLLYSANVAKRYIRDPADLLALAIEETNETFRNSGIGNVKLRLVHTQVVEHDTTVDDQFTHLYAMVDGLGPFKDVKRLRKEKRADIVGLIIDNPNGCGLSTRVGPDSDDAFFVVHHACATITMSVAHEIGHILGARHDRFMDESNVPVAYGHGYVNGAKWRTMMSYKEGCGGCPRIPFWSNPRVVHKGEPTGSDAADNARLILERAERVSKFR
ncbi:MAG: M12 family metallo-peptidase [Hyphomicrobiaceae bacterium]